MMRALFFRGMPLLAFLFFLQPAAFAQTEAEAAPVKALVLTSVKDSAHIHYLPQGKRVTVSRRDSTEKLRGKMDSLDFNAIYVDSVRVPLHEIETIRGRSVGMLVVNLIGGVISLMGGFATGAGFVMLANALAAADPFFTLLVSIVAVIIILLGLFVLAVGLVPLLLRGKKYKIGEKWTLRSGIRPPKKK